MKSVCHCSYSTIRKYLRDIVGITISRGQLSKLVQNASAALGQAYNELLEHLPKQARLNVDETSHKENKKRFWTWCFQTELCTLFKIADTRGSRVLIDVLDDDFDGVIRFYMPDYSSPFLRSTSPITTEAIAAIFTRPHPVNGCQFI